MDKLQRAGRDFLLSLVAQHGLAGAARVLRALAEDLTPARGVLDHPPRAGLFVFCGRVGRLTIHRGGADLRQVKYNPSRSNLLASESQNDPPTDAAIVSRGHSIYSHGGADDGSRRLYARLA